MPTGEQTGGTAQAMYSSALKPHFPRVHSVSGIGMMPMSKLCRSDSSLSSRQRSTVRAGLTGGT